MGADKIVRHWMVGRISVEAVTQKKARSEPLSIMEGSQEPDPVRTGEMHG